MYLQRYENVVTSRYFVWNAVTQLVLLHNILRNKRGTMRVNELKIPSQSGNANSVAFYKIKSTVTTITLPIYGHD